MKRYNINYDVCRNCFELFKDIPSELIWGDLTYVINPFFTYMIPTYGRAYLLEETLQSVLNQLSVDFEWDIIVVDNEAGPGNETEQVIRNINNPRILYYRNKENIGVDGNYNRCIELARGQWVAMLHADDLLINDHLKLMGQYIKAHLNDRKPLAYISPRYVEFANRDNIMLERPKAVRGDQVLIYQYLAQDSFRGKLKRFRQIDGVLSGYSVSLPSFGTVMNRAVMLRMGGFDEKLGICEDVITPYKLAGSYKVYKTPKVMGFYRFENNESMKIETILKIYASMVDFREYMYDKNIFTRIWGKLARNELNRVLVDYCIQLSRFSDRRMKKEDFIEIYTPERQSWFSLKMFQLIEAVYVKLSGFTSFKESVDCLLENAETRILQRKKVNNQFIIYGAGRVGTETLKFLKKRMPDINIVCVAVSEATENTKVIGKNKPKAIDELIEYRETATVITATIIQQYQDEMNEKLKQYYFLNVINLMENIR